MKFLGGVALFSREAEFDISVLNNLLVIYRGIRIVVRTGRTS